jgi:hypothetical protein
MTLSSPEFGLALACSIWPPSDRRIQSIRAAASGSVDWDRFVRVVQRHRVIGLVHDGLTRAQIGLPPHIAQKIAAQASELVRENLALAAEAVRLQRLFAEANLPVAFIKGISLAALAYGNLGLRHGKDLDLLVSPEIFPAAAALIEAAGYQRFDPPPGISESQLRLLMSMRKDFGYTQANNHHELELHWRLFFNPHFMDERQLIASSRIVPLTDTIGLRTLGEDDLFAYLCAHGALHWWYQLKWIADIGALLAQVPQDEVERLYRAAHARGVGLAAAQGILLCHGLLGTPVSHRLVAALRESRRVRWLEATALKAMTAGNGEIQPHDLLFGTTRGSFSCFLLGRNWHYWLAELKLHLICQTDVLTMSLPERLKFLYPLLRLPLWLWRHSIRRDRLPQ